MSTLLDQYNGDTPDTPTCFPLVHFYQHLFLYDKNSNLIFSMVSTYHGSNYQGSKSNDGVIEVTYQFSNQSSPSSTQITIHNLTKANARKFKKGNTVSIWAGWEDSDRLYNNITQIFKSTISTVSPLQDSSGDWIMSVTCQDGQKFDNETALSKLYKSESKSIRKRATNVDQLSRSGRKQIRSIEHKYGIRGNNIESIKKQLGPKEKAIDARLSKKEKREESALMSQFPTIHNGHHGRRGSNEESHNHEIVEERKAARDKIIANTRAARNAIKNQFSLGRQKLSNRRKRNTQAKKRAVKHVRTRIASRKQKQRRKDARRKTKAKKTKSSGLHFKKNTKASTIIRRLAKIGHIPISRLDLIHNKIYHSGYTATGKPFAEIQNVVSDCDSNIWWPHGKLVIGDFADHPRLNFTLTPDTGLVQPPEPEDDGDSDDDDDSSTKPKNKKQRKQLQDAVPTKYDVTSVFLPFLTTGSEFQIIDPGSDMLAIQRNDNSNDINAGDLFQGEVVVVSGELDIEAGSMPEAQFTVEYASAVRRAQSIKNKTKAQKLAQQKAAKDKKRRHRVKSKRRTRRAKRARAKKPKTSKRK